MNKAFFFNENFPSLAYGVYWLMPPLEFDHRKKSDEKTSKTTKTTISNITVCVLIYLTFGNEFEIERTYFFQIRIRRYTL